jgi:hypothetical protein
VNASAQAMDASTITGAAMSTKARLLACVWGLVLLGGPVTARAYEINQKTNSVKVMSVADFEKCNAEIDSEACLDALKAFVQAHPRDAFEAGKKVRLNFNHWVALPFFNQAFAKPPAPEQCNDEDVWMAVSSGLSQPTSNPNLAVAAKIGGDLCWAQLQGKLAGDLKEGGVYYREHTCSLLKKKGIERVECQPVKTAETASVKSSSNLSKLQADWTKLKLDQESATMLRGQGDEQVLMVQAGPKQESLYLVKFKGIQGPWNNKTLLTMETPGGGSGRNYVAAVDSKEWVALTVRDGRYEAYPKDNRDSVYLYPVPLADRQKRLGSAELIKEFSSPAPKK